uniref:Pleckstrin homology domain containing, family O member 2 n=1 Tax=Neogobius melanostomus TaxID=47308 RepID=A0A8C6UEW1_9GOBI
MEDKEDPAVRTKTGFQGKCGWMKKAYGRVLSSYKDRYVSVDKTEILVYENEDQKNCLERVDLENYDKCHEMKSGFKRKHRLVLIRSPKSANKVQDLKFQAQSAEEKDAWIKALSDAINRAKNKIFDVVKVDESSNLEHVTRSRPKGNRSRRPPTRIHMKEVADVSSDGILRLDLDLENAMMPNGTHSSSSAVDGTENHEKTTPSPSSSDSTEDKALSTINEAKGEDPSQTKVLKPPMPPSKQTAIIEEEKEEEEEVPEKKILKPPMPPSKDVKPSETTTDKTPETSPDSKKKIPPMPPNKPLSSLITPINPSPSKTTVHPPSPPSKEKKPNASAEISQSSTENVEKEEIDKTEPEKDIANEEHITPPRLAKSPQLPPKQEERPKLDVPAPVEEVEECKGDVLVVEVCLKDSESVNLSPLLGRIGEDKEKKAEEKSLDSGQHSDEDELEDSVSEDASPTGESNNDLDTLDSKSSKTEILIRLKPQICPSKGYTAWDLKPPTPLQPKTKVRSASSCDLLSDSPDFRAVDVKNLESEVALQMEDTSELLNRASQAQTVPRGDKNPENLLAEAMEKLKRADHMLREVKKLKLTKDTSRRKSW